MYRSYIFLAKMTAIVKNSLNIAFIHYNRKGVGHNMVKLHLTHWGWVMHICISKLTTTGSNNGSSPSQHQAIIWTNTEILLTRPLRTNSSEMLIKIYTFSFKKMHLKMSKCKLTIIMSRSQCVTCIEVYPYVSHVWCNDQHLIINYCKNSMS